MKHSIYNILVKLDTKKYIIYNTYSSAVGVLDDKVLDVYNNISNIDISDKNINSEVKMLIENGFVIQDNIDEFSKICIEEKIDRYKNSSLNLTIAPTLACNMRCIYCYEEKKPINMSNETCDSLINFIKELIKKNKFENCSKRKKIGI